MFTLITNVYIDQQQYDDLMTLLQTIADNQNNILSKLTDSHTGIIAILVTFILFMMLWGWGKFIYHAFVEPVGDD